MNKNLLLKTVFIIAVLIVFLFGIFGIPGSFTGEGLRAAVQKRIHLGLDLKGGTHLILQVQVNDAVNAESDRAVERLKDALKSGNIAFGEISKPDPQQPSRSSSRSRACRRSRRRICAASSARSSANTTWPPAPRIPGPSP